MNNPMYTIIKSRIEAGSFKLADMIRRIREEQWHDTITEAERDELIEELVRMYVSSIEKE